MWTAHCDYCSKAALIIATCSSLLELVFFFSWFVNRGSPHGMFPSHNAAIVVLLMTLSAGIASTKRW